MFKFAADAPGDQVTMELWRGNKRLSVNRVNVKLAEERKSAEPLPVVQIEITEVPPNNRGGEDTHAEIAGKVSGQIASDHRVLLYARSDYIWYIQPSVDTLHAITPDGMWASWTHTGSDYAALIVRRSFAPRPFLDAVPEVGGDVLARVVVQGRRK
jgi:hypothetical protein